MEKKAQYWPQAAEAKAKRKLQYFGLFFLFLYFIEMWSLSVHFIDYFKIWIVILIILVQFFRVSFVSLFWSFWSKSRDLNCNFLKKCFSSDLRFIFSVMVVEKRTCHRLAKVAKNGSTKFWVVVLSSRRAVIALSRVQTQ